MKTSKNDRGLYAWALLRIVLGYIFAWAFLDKLFGLGFSTCRDKVSGAIDAGCSQAWVHGGSPTSGFLGHAATGPFAGFYHHLAGHAWVDWAFMLALAFIGLGLMLGTWVKSASLAGIVLLAMMWSALLWPLNAPGVDEHIVYILVLFCFLFGHMPYKLSLNGWWKSTNLGKKLS